MMRRMGRTAGHALAGLALALALPLGTSAGLAKSKDEKNWVERVDNRRDARRAGIVAGAVTAQVAGAANRSRADRDYQQCQDNVAATQSPAQGAYGQPADSNADYAAQKAGYDCEVQRYEDRADGRAGLQFRVVDAGPGCQGDGEALVEELDRAGFAVGSGSACTSAALEPSHVLAAMGVLTHGNVRIALPATTPTELLDAQIDQFLDVLPPVVERVRNRLGGAGL